MSNSQSPLLGVNDPQEFNQTNVNPTKIPLVPLLMDKPAPLAKTEIDEVDADHHAPSAPLAPFPGIDDGFFDEKSSDKTINSKDSSESKIPEFELTVPPTPDHTKDIPIISLRFGEEDDSASKVDETDTAQTDEGKSLKINRNLLSPPPTYGMDFETGSIMGTNDGSIPDVNIYQHKKTLAQGMMDLALFSANANQLRYVVESNMHPYYYPSVVMITMSLILQVSKKCILV